MTEFNINDIKVVGFVDYDPKPHCSIEVVGYFDSGFHFFPLTKAEAKRIFPDNGHVFAPNFSSKEYAKKLVGQCICAGIKESSNNGRDQYVVDYNNGGEIFSQGTLIYNYSNENVDINSPSSFHDFLGRIGAFDAGNKFIFRIGKKLFICESTRMKKDYIVYEMELDVALSTEKENFLIGSNGRYAVWQSDIKGVKTPIDILPDKLIAHWLKENILSNDWIKLLSSNNTHHEEFIERLFLKSRLPESIVARRVRRATTMLDRVSFTYNELISLAKSPQFSTVISKSISLHCQNYINDVRNGYSSQLEELEMEHQLNIEAARRSADETIFEINSQIEEKEEELSLLEEEITKTKANALEDIQKLENAILSKKDEYQEWEDKLYNILSEKDKLIGDFSIIKDVINLIGAGSSKQSDIKQDLNDSNESDTKGEFFLYSLESENEPLTSIKDFVSRLSQSLSSNNRSNDIAKKLCKLLIENKVILVPDAIIAQSIINATGRCEYDVRTVTPKWHSFQNVWENGLSNILDNCYDNSNVIHYLILQNVNLSYIPCYLQPVIDILNGLTPTFPDTDDKYPDNLRIILTITQEDGLPISEQSIKYFGCLTNKDYTIDLKKERHRRPWCECTPKGYLPVDFLNEKPLGEWEMSDYKSYVINNDEE